ncbi:NAD(P)-dependent oxidoreductase [Cellulosimicrobium marinum]|uniref:NAD(P)-dependent oxidoreductase n=1 Tax=Cellulosimicrobium marinum TaxID=1638992 RepID=UPI001E4B161A|nr:NAD(P)-binding oxidoreductase [Cellulosimicrobium marinum]MCB7136174.1 SDR family oxidoreductase [Cellulosimicrobium marinum]
MRIAVLGATGRTGSELTEQALAAGHEVVAYVRRPGALALRPGLTVVGGALDDADALAGATAGCDAVVLTLGPKISDSHKPLMQVAVPAAIAAAHRAGVKRVVVLSALGAGATLANTRYPYRFGCRTFLAANFRDHVAGESQLVDSGLHWTTVHPGPLSDRPRTPHPTVVDASTGYRMPGAPRTTRADVAATILGLLDDPRTYGAQVLVTSAVQSA